MFDNGLIKYYQQGFSSNGELCLKRFTRCQHLFKDGVLKMFITPENLYFSKTGSPAELDAEIMLSQIYKRAGLDSAIYTPAVDTKGNNVVLSNNVAFTGVVAQQYFQKLQTQNQGFPWGVTSEDMPFSTLPDFATKQGARDFIKMTLFDVGSANFDRTNGNYIIKTSQDGKIDGVCLYDYGASGISSKALTSSLSGFYENEMTYPNLFNDYERLTRPQMIEELKTNEGVLQYIKPTEMAEMLGQVNVGEVAQDINNQIGYRVDQEYVDFISSSFENIAQQLIK